jgi:small conductance mechanosensitive channel
MDETLQAELGNLQAVYDTILEFTVNYSFQIVGALLVIFIGYFVARKASKLVVNLCEKKNIDITLRTYIGHIVYLAILVSFIIIAVGKLGISITPFVAAIGALSLGAGLAVQGLLSNYGAGIAIIISRPFRVGDTIRINDVGGEVKEIRLANTILDTEDGEEIMIPNRHVVGEIIHNSFGNRVVETVVGVDYNTDPDNAITCIKSGLSTLDFISDSPAPQVGIESFGDFSINIGVRYWVPTNRFFACKYIGNQHIFKAIQDAGINIPFPRVDIKLPDGKQGLN